MLKYLYKKVVFRELPDEISLALSLTGCRIHCPGCHSPELWEDEGTPLDESELRRLIKEHHGVSCLLLLGGEHEQQDLLPLFLEAKRQGLKTAWYSGLDEMPSDNLLTTLDYIKIGHYDAALGPLGSPKTNQRLYHIDQENNQLININL